MRPVDALFETLEALGLLVRKEEIRSGDGFNTKRSQICSTGGSRKVWVGGGTLT